MRTTNQEYRTETTVLAVAVEMAKNSWKVGLDDGYQRRPRVKRCDADVAAERFFEVTQLIEQIRVEWDLPDSVRIVVGYEAGQDGFWLARALEEAGYEAVVIDPASIPVERHRRRSKTDRLDAIRLVLALRRWLRGERDAMRPVRIPTCELEDQRWHSRDRKQLQKERNQHRDRIRKLLRTQGCWEPIGRDFAKRLERGAIRDWRGAALGAGLRARLALEWKRLELARRNCASVKPSRPSSSTPTSAPGSSSCNASRRWDRTARSRWSWSCTGAIFATAGKWAVAPD